MINKINKKIGEAENNIINLIDDMEKELLSIIGDKKITDCNIVVSDSFGDDYYKIETISKVSVNHIDLGYVDELELSISYGSTSYGSTIPLVELYDDCKVSFRELVELIKNVDVPTLESNLSIYKPFNYEVTLEATDGKTHVAKGVHDGEDDSWYAHKSTNNNGEEVAFTINVYGGTSYGDTDTDIFVNTYQCTTRSKESKTGWCNDNYIELSGATIKVSKIEENK